MTTRPDPLFVSQPVILIHLLASLDSNQPFCDPSKEYWGDDGSNFLGVPRVMCPACAKAPVEYGNPQ